KKLPVLLGIDQLADLYSRPPFFSSPPPVTGTRARSSRLLGKTAGFASEGWNGNNYSSRVRYDAVSYAPFGAPIRVNQCQRSAAKRRLPGSNSPTSKLARFQYAKISLSFLRRTDITPLCLVSSSFRRL